MFLYNVVSRQVNKIYIRYTLFLRRIISKLTNIAVSKYIALLSPASIQAKQYYYCNTHY